MSDTKARTRVRLAPVFSAARRKSTKPVSIEMEQTVAKKAFLHSAAPETLRAQVCSTRETKSGCDSSEDFAGFPTITHVRQIEGESDKKIARICGTPLIFSSWNFRDLLYETWSDF